LTRGGMLAGLETVDDGVIRIGERDVTGADPRDRDIAMVFQNYALFPHMTVAQNMGFALKVAKIPKAAIRERVPNLDAKLRGQTRTSALAVVSFDDS
jgi:ABC-type sugar transport system ATPase subunit